MSTKTATDVAKPEVIEAEVVVIPKISDSTPTLLDALNNADKLNDLSLAAEEHVFKLSYIHMGLALGRIRDLGKFAEAGYGNFTDYVSKVHGIGKSVAYQMIDSARQAHALYVYNPQAPIPGNKGQAAALAAGKLEPAQAYEVMEKAVKDSEGRPTAKDIKQAIAELFPKSDEEKAAEKAERDARKAERDAEKEAEEKAAASRPLAEKIEEAFSAVDKAIEELEAVTKAARPGIRGIDGPKIQDALRAYLSNSGAKLIGASRVPATVGAIEANLNAVIPQTEPEDVPALRKVLADALERLEKTNDVPAEPVKKAPAKKAAPAKKEADK